MHMKNDPASQRRRPTSAMPVILGMAVAFGCVVTLIVKEVGSGLSRGISATSLMAVEPLETTKSGQQVNAAPRTTQTSSLDLPTMSLDVGSPELGQSLADATHDAAVSVEEPAEAEDIATAEPAPAVVAEQPAATSSQAQPTRDDTPMFNGRPLRKVREVNMLVTAYSPDERSCGIWADGITASGYSVWTNGMRLVAADTRILPFGSIVSVPGYNGGKPVPVLDRGGAIKGNRLDVLYPTHEIALRWGVQRLPIIIWEYADE